MVELMRQVLEKVTPLAAARWLTGDDRTTESELDHVLDFLSRNPQAPYAVLFYNPELRVGAPINAKWLLVGPQQTVTTLDQAANMRLDTELASTTIWPKFYIDNPHYKEA